MITISFWNIAFTVINLLILFVAVRIFFFKPIQEIIAKRQAEANEQFDEAMTQKNEAEAIKASLENELKDAENTKKAVIAEARKTADGEYQRIIDDAKSEAKQIRKDAVASAEHEKNEILSHAKKEIADMVVDATTKIVGTKAGAEVDSELFDKFLGKAGE